jgi:UDP-N-acetylglucosamine 2-epimerase (non-hydrolysing)
MTSRRTIAVFTSTRADAGPLGPVIRALDAATDCCLVLIATGAHLDERRGHTVDALHVGPDSVLEVVDTGVTADDPQSLVQAVGPVAEGVADVLASHEVDVLVLLGDRWELLAAASAAVLLQIPIAHLHGGEVTEGALDERVRHAITKLSDFHWCATEESAARLRQMGEEAWRITVTGAPALDGLADAAATGRHLLADRLGGTPPAPWGIVTYHPPTVDRREVRRRVGAVLDAATSLLRTVVVTYPGLDPGGSAVIEQVDHFAAAHDNVVAVPSLDDAYAAALDSADVMVGNSSSGVIEAASFRLPVVNVGDRQLGRLAPPNVIAVGESRGEIERGIGQALDPDFRAGLTDLVNPYGDGHAAERILAALRSAPLDRTARKRFVEASR